MHKTVHNQDTTTLWAFMPEINILYLIYLISYIYRIRIWTESWNLKDYDTRRALMYQLIERKPVHGNNEHRILDCTKYWIQKYWIIQNKNAF